MTKLVEEIELLDNLLSNKKLHLKPYRDYMAKLRHIVAPQALLIKGIDLYSIVNSDEQSENDLLALSKYGLLGIVQKGVTLDQKILEEFRLFVEEGYQRFNTWWQSGKYDKSAAYGLLVKEGKISVKTTSKKGLYPIKLVPSFNPSLIANTIESMEHTLQLNLAKHTKFAAKLQQELDITLLPELTDSASGKFRIKAKVSMNASNQELIRSMYVEMLLTAIFCSTHFPNCKNFQVSARNNYVEVGQFIVECTEVHVLSLSLTQLHQFLGKYLAFEDDNFVTKNLKNTELFPDLAIAFVKENTQIVDQHSHPIDK